MCYPGLLCNDERDSELRLHQVLWKTFDFAKNGCRVSASETNLKNSKNARSLLARKVGVFAIVTFFRPLFLSTTAQLAIGFVGSSG
jgi:hypothetical protein